MKRKLRISTSSTTLVVDGITTKFVIGIIRKGATNEEITKSLPKNCSHTSLNELKVFCSTTTAPIQMTSLGETGPFPYSGNPTFITGKIMSLGIPSQRMHWRKGTNILLKVKQ